MTDRRVEDLVCEVVTWVEGHNQNAGLTHGRIDPETDLLGEGVLDSVGFVELLKFIEDTTGWRIDLVDLDPAEFTKIGPLCRHAVATNT